MVSQTPASALSVLDYDRRRTLSRNQQVLREGPLFINPLPLAPESRPFRHSHNFLCLVLVRALRPNRFAFVEHHAHIRRRNLHALPPRRTQMHLDSPLFEIPTRLMLEARQVTIRPPLAIHSPLHIHVTTPSSPHPSLLS